MQIVRKNEANIHKNNEVNIATEYKMTEPDINGAVVEMSGRYPAKGLVMNEVCKELVYILEGSGKVVLDGEREIELNVGDLILLNPGEKYYWEGQMKTFISCTPAWYPEQHKEIK